MNHPIVTIMNEIAEERNTTVEVTFLPNGDCESVFADGKISRLTLEATKLFEHHPMAHESIKQEIVKSLQ